MADDIWGGAWGDAWGDSWGETSSPGSVGVVSTRRPVVRSVSMRGLVIALAGREQPYAVYQFGRRRKYERPGHNPYS